MKRLKVKVNGNENVNIVFHAIFAKMDRFTSNQDLNDQRPFLHISLNRFQQQKCFVFVIFIT